MNQNGYIVPILVGVLALAIVGGGAAIYLTRSTGTNTTETQNTADRNINNDVTGTSGASDDLKPDPPAGGDIGSFTGSVTDLLARNEDLTCSFEQLENGTTVAGTVYLEARGKRLRGDTAITGPDGTRNIGHNIQKDGFNYAWFDGQPMGSKVPITDDDLSATDTADDPDILSEDFSYACQPWSVDTSVFNLPANITFDDLSQQIQQIDAGTQLLDQAQCAACDALTGPEKTQCQQALGC